MKRTSIFYFSLAAIAVGSLASCQDFDPLNEDELQKVQLEKDFLATLDEYTLEFESRYGKIDPNHKWGFGPIDLSQTRAQVVNKNEWESHYHLQVPGWPITYVDGSGKTHVTSTYRNGDSGKQNVGDAKTSVPGGDVTDEEVAYVSWWFRTHRYPTSLNVHWSDFFLQEVSADKDRNSDGNAINRVAEYEDKGDYLVETNQGGQTYQIDQLFVQAYDNGTVWDHMKNFNSGASNTLHNLSGLHMGDTYNWEDLSKYPSDTNGNRMIDFFYCSGTEDWAAHYSNDEKWRYNGNKTFHPTGEYAGHNADGNDKIWVLVHLHFIGKSGHIYDNYYIGFDYAFEKVEGNKTQFLYADGYYSNWILKVNPAIPQVQSVYSRRIMCEDLGTTDDLDFDDIVFDATINGNNIGTDGKYDVTINLMASGGTMPIWAGVNPGTDKSNIFEAHKLFNTSSTTPVNVKNGYEAPIANYHIKMDPTSEGKADFEKIGIYVFNTKKNQWIELSDVKKVVSGDNYTNPQAPYQPESGKNYAPQKFAVPINVLWLKERCQIESAYPLFANWVKNDAGFGEGSEATWYTTQVSRTNLCGQAGQVPVVTTPTPGSVEDTGLSGTTSTWKGQHGLNYTIYPNVNNKDRGTVSVSGDAISNNTFIAGKTVTLNAIPAAGYEFVGWSGDVSGNTAEITVTMNEDKYVMANFRPTGGAGGSAYKLTLIAHGGTVDIISVERNSTMIDERVNFQDQDKVTISLTSTPTGKVFIGWKENDNEYYLDPNPTNKQIVFNTGQDIKIEAIYADAYQMPVSVSFVDAGDQPISYSNEYSNLLYIGTTLFSYQNPTGNYDCAVGRDLVYSINLDSEYEVYLNDVKLEDVNGNKNFTVTVNCTFSVKFKRKSTSN